MWALLLVPAWALKQDSCHETGSQTTLATTQEVAAGEPEWQDYRPWAQASAVEAQEKPPKTFDLTASVVNMKKVIRIPLSDRTVENLHTDTWRMEYYDQPSWGSIRSWRVIVHIEAQEKPWRPFPEGDPEALVVAYRCGDAPIQRIAVLNTAAEESFFCQPSHWDPVTSRPSCVVLEVDAKASDWCEVAVFRNDSPDIAEALLSEETCGREQRCCARGPEDTKKKKKTDPEGPKFPAICVQEDLRLRKSTCRDKGGTKVSNERCMGSAIFTDIGKVFRLLPEHVPRLGSGCGGKALCCRWREPVEYLIPLRVSDSLALERWRLGVKDDESANLTEITANVLRANEGYWRDRKGEALVARAVALAGGHGGLAKSILMKVPDSDDGYHACVHASECPDVPSLDPKLDKVLKGEAVAQEMCSIWPKYAEGARVRQMIRRREEEEARRRELHRPMEEPGA
jgi:hypothetical protein